MSRLPALVVVSGGCAYEYVHPDVDLQIVDLDNLKESGTVVVLPAGRGFENLVAQAGVEDQVAWEQEH